MADNRETVPPGAAVALTGGVVFWVSALAAVPSFNGKDVARVEDTSMQNCSN